MHNNDKYLDSKLIEELWTRTPSGMIAQFLLTTIFATLTRAETLQNFSLFLCFALLYFLTGLRGFAAYNLYKSSLRRTVLKFIYNFSIIAMGLTWAYVAVHFISRGWLNPYSIIIWLIFSGIASASAHTLAPTPRLSFLFYFAILFPPSLALIVKNASPEAYSVAFIANSYALYLTLQTRVQFNNLKKLFFNEKHLIDERKKLQNTIDSVPGFIIILNTELEVIAATQKHNFPPTLNPIVREFKHSPREIQSVEFNLENQNTTNHYMVTMRKVNSPEQDIILYGIEINDWKKTQLELEQQKINIIHASKLSSLGEMAAGIAHEINNPLAIIISKTETTIAQIKQSQISNYKIDDSLKIIIETTERISKIIKGLRFFARSDDDQPFEPTPLQTIIEETLAISEARLNLNQIKIQVDLNNKNLIMDCKPVQISQVLINLINNSFDAIQTIPYKWIHIQATSDSSTITISVTDSGKGIPPHIAEKIMQPFFTTKEVGKGTGLGLSISKGIIEKHHGNFYYDDKSINTKFVIELPMKQLT